MKIALVLDRKLSEVGYSEVTHTLELADRLVYLGGHTVTVLTIEGPVSEEYTFSVVGILGQATSWGKSEAIHGWLLANPQDVVYGPSRNGLLLVEQIVGSTPTMVRPGLNLLDAAVAGVFEDPKLPEAYRGSTLRQYAWSTHSAESASILNASLVVGYGSDFELHAKSIGTPRTRQLPMAIQEVGKPNVGEGILVMAGRYTKLKGAEYIPGIVNSIPENISVAIVAGQYWADDSFTRKVDLSDKYLDRNDLYQMYKNCAAVLIPSRITGFSLTTLEAFSFGKPVICFNPTDPAKNSWPLWRMGHPRIEGFKSLPEILKLLDTKEEEASKYRESLCEFAKQFTWNTLMPEYLQAFETAIANAVTQGRTARSW